MLTDVFAAANPGISANVLVRVPLAQEGVLILFLSFKFQLVSMALPVAPYIVIGIRRKLKPSDTLSRVLFR